MDEEEALAKCPPAFAEMVRRNREFMEEHKEAMMDKKQVEDMVADTERIQALEDEVVRLSKLLAASEEEKRKFTHARQRYEAEKEFFYQERTKTEVKARWLQMSQGRALDLIRQFIDAHYNLYGEYPKMVQVPGVLYRELHGTEWIEFYLPSTYDWFEHPHSQVSRIRIRLVEID